MNLDTLIEILTDYRDELGGEAEVRLMTQQSWPFENRICGVTSGRDMNDAEDEDAEDDDAKSPTKTRSTSSRVDRFATAANERGRRPATVDRHIGPPRKDFANSILTAVDVLTFHCTCVLTQPRIQPDPPTENQKDASPQ